jgi:hypothetical protein
MALQQIGWRRLCQFVPVIVVIIVACPATARVTAPDAQRQWETLTAQAREVYQAGGYGRHTS